MKKLAVFIITFSIFYQTNAQVHVVDSAYYVIKKGVYKTKSLNSELFKPTYIQPQKTIIPGRDIAFLQVSEKVISLFKTTNESGKEKPIGVLAETSIVEIDSIFYNEIYEDTSTTKYITFNVWYAIKINGVKYYTDCKIHDFVAFSKQMPKFEGDFYLIAKNDGYDEYYDKGYPDDFIVIITQKRNNSIVFVSKILKFNCGEEFWEPAWVDFKSIEGGYEFKINCSEGVFSGIWTGDSLIKSL